MDGRSIVLTSISCKGVKYFALFQKPSVYASVSIAGGDDPKKQKRKTSADHEGGENPEWDQTMQFDLEHGEFQELFLEFRIMAQGNLLGDKLIGESRALIADLAEGNPPGVVRHVSYQVRSSDGKPNGVLSFSYKLNLPEMEIRHPRQLDPMIPYTPLKDTFPPPSAPYSFLSLPAPAPRESLYPPLPLPEDSTVDCFYYHNHPSPPDPANYFTPPPRPPPPAVEYYPPSDWAVYTPVSTQDTGYLSGNVHANREYYPPPPAEVPPPMAAFGTNYPPSAEGYYYPPYPQDSCCYCNCNCN